MKTNKLFNLFFNIAFALIISTLITSFAPVPLHPLMLAAGIFTVCSVFRFSVISFLLLQRRKMDHDIRIWMAVQTEVWENFIAENLFKVYDWVRRAKDRSGFVLNNAVVHIPQAGAKPRTTKNRENFPIPVVKRNDSDITYAIDELSTESTYIPDADKIELSYDKISDVFGDHVNQLSRDSAMDILDRWYPTLAANMVRTTGTAILSHLTGATGNRKKFTEADVAAAKTELIKQTKRETGNRSLIMSEDMYNQLKSDSVVKDKDTMDSVGAVWKDGDLIKLHGFDIIRTDVTGRYSNAGTPVLQEYATRDVGATTDNDVVLLVDWTKVHFALGDVKFFESVNDVHFQGDVYNALVRFGGRKERANEEGVIAIIQDASA